MEGVGAVANVRREMLPIKTIYANTNLSRRTAILLSYAIFIISIINSVAIAGASGALGPHVLKGLIDTKFQVKILTRSKKPGEFDACPGVEVAEVDFTSVESLTAALKGIDAVVSTVAGTAIKYQTVLIDAAAAAGVKRFIPSEYGSVTTNPKLEKFPLYENVFMIRRHLQEKADAGLMSWTVLACGAFMESLLVPGAAGLLDFAERKALLLDEGDNRLSCNSLATSGKAIAAILKNTKATKNRVVKISEVILTPNQLLNMAQRMRPQDK
ncbi:NAD(P)-binding protein [Mollisia scopiformis]|uniref:NAD(P)-binding protein n=1 Tax=Mollisia scopiformis TaxID=149040 RepID=A0A132B495_MOLSC|nr:NAD(P)-binding protein [Mollisia scopiformis]KUJ07161.1 NAD(P)-binding protein [Mollisia scopiformis]